MIAWGPHQDKNLKKNPTVLWDTITKKINAVRTRMWSGDGTISWTHQKNYWTCCDQTIGLQVNKTIQDDHPSWTSPRRAQDLSSMMALLIFWSTFRFQKGSTSGNMQRFASQHFQSGPSQLALNLSEGSGGRRESAANLEGTRRSKQHPMPLWMQTQSKQRGSRSARNFCVCLTRFTTIIALELQGGASDVYIRTYWQKVLLLLSLQTHINTLQAHIITLWLCNIFFVFDRNGRL